MYLIIINNHNAFKILIEINSGLIFVEPQLASRTPQIVPQQADKDAAEHMRLFL